MQNGLFSLKTAQDLYRKLEHDFNRLKTNPSSPYIAFDFFVTAEHMLDWEFPGYDNSKKRHEMRDEYEILRICSHIASGAKHFTVEDQRHSSVVKTSAYHGGFQSNAFQSKAFQTNGGLVIVLDDNVSSEFGGKTGVISLAEKVMSFWSARLKQTHTE